MTPGGNIMNRKIRNGLAAVMVAAVTSPALAQAPQAPAAPAAQPPATNIRGTITAFDGTTLSIKSREGTDVKVTIPPNANVAVEKAFHVSDIMAGMKLAVVTVGRPDGSVIALNVRPLPAQVPSTTAPYDLAPGSIMNNVAVDQVVATDGGKQLTLATPAGPVKALIVPQTTMSQTAPGTRDDLKVGEMVFIGARPDATGTLVAGRIEVGKDGVEPGE
jgi:hypothetical protein